MSEKVKQTWIDFVETYLEARLLWDPKHENKNNKGLRAEAYERLLEEYQKIDENASLEDMKNKLANMRTTFHRERKKVLESLQNGNEFVYKPTLWYFDLFNSYVDPNPNTEVMKFDTIRHFKKTMSVVKPSRRSERERFRAETHNESTKEMEVEESSETPPPAQKKRRIYNLLQKQERFVDTASHLLHGKEKEWEINGKAIGLQLYQLDATQRTIAQKLMSDTLFFGSLGKLTEESFINLNNYTPRQASPELHEEIDYLEEELEDDE